MSSAMALVADQLREKYPKIATFMDGCKDEVLVHMAFSKTHRHAVKQHRSAGAFERRDQASHRRRGEAPSPMMRWISTVTFPPKLGGHRFRSALGDSLERRS